MPVTMGRVLGTLLLAQHVAAVKLMTNANIVLSVEGKMQHWCGNSMNVG